VNRLLVVDTSAFVSLGVGDVLEVVLEESDIATTSLVIEELEGTATYDDASGEAAQAVLDRQAAFDVRSVELDETFPLDDGENAVVTLANKIEAVQLLCDEFNRLALVHASLVDTRLVTTSSVLTALVRNDVLSPDVAEEFLETMSEARSWSANTIHTSRVRKPRCNSDEMGLDER
jgi:predicted nucleic acid-binding protein